MSTGGRDLRWPWFAPGSSPGLRPGDTVRFADLAGMSFQADLIGVTFFGCAMNGTSFSGQSFVGCSFVGCLASRHGESMHVGEASGRPLVLRSHLEQVEGVAPAPQWPDDVAELAWQALQGDNLVRYEALEMLGARGFSGAAPLMAVLLRDEEWEVRATAVRALTVLRGRGFPDGDQALLTALVTAVGDRSSIVAIAAEESMEQLQPSPAVVTSVIDGVRGSEPAEVITALRVAASLAMTPAWSGVVATAFDGAALRSLLDSPEEAVRAEYLRTLGMADQNVAEAWEAGLHDEHPQVRAGALAAIRYLSDPPAVELVQPLLRDQEEIVRIETLFTLGQLGGFDPDVVTAALSDRSEQVRDYAATLLRGGS